LRRVCYFILEIEIELLGIGGSGQALAFSLVWKGVRSLHLVNRHLEKAVQIQTHLMDQFPEASGILKIAHPDSEEFQAALSQADVLINATGVGYEGQTEGQMPLNSLDSLNPQAQVFDLAARPLATEFLLRAHARGNRVYNGVAMSLFSQARHFHSWLQPFSDLQILIHDLVSAMENFARENLHLLPAEDILQQPNFQTPTPKKNSMDTRSPFKGETAA
jgi:shikimate dehydrogenase